MSFALSSITSRIRSRLNDAVDATYHDAVLLPFAQDACDELQLELELNGSLALETISAALTVPAATTVLSTTSTPALPTDMLEPQRLEEKLSGSSDLYVGMIRREWEPQIQQTDSMRYWTYRNQNIYMPGATTIRAIQIYYLKRALNITTIDDVVTINNSQQFLINRIAAFACRFIGSNPTRADELDKIAAEDLNKVVRIGAKSRQGTRTRRRPFVLSGRRRWV